MKKSVHTIEYAALLRTLRDVRRSTKVTQVELADRVGETQSEVSKWERGETRLDVVQLRTLCHALGTTLPGFVKKYEARLVRGGRSARGR